MIKKFMCFVLLLCNMLCVTSCQKSGQYIATETISNHSENVCCSEDMNDFWLYQDTLYYIQDGFYNMQIFCADQEGTKRLISEYSLPDDQKIINIQVYNDQLYILTFSEAQNSVFYKFNVSDKSYEMLLQASGHVFQWTVYGNDLFYGQYTGDSFMFEDIYRFDMKTGIQHQIISAARMFSLSDSKILYITGIRDYKVCTYDINSEKQTETGHFSYQRDIQFLGLSSVGVAMCESEENRNKLMVYDQNLQKLSEYIMPAEIQKTSCGHEYLFITLYNCQNDRTTIMPSDANGLFRLNLKTGNLERLSAELLDLYSMFVVSDDCVYVAAPQGKGKISVNIYRVDAIEKSVAHLFRY